MKNKLAMFAVLIATSFAIPATSALAKKQAAPVSHTPSPSYHNVVTEMAHKHNIPPALAHAVIRIESNYNANAKGKAGEIGLMQIKLATARELGFSGSAKALYDPRTNLEYGMKYLSQAHRLGQGNICQTILKYNAGHGARRMNATTSRYCSRVKDYMGMN